MTRLAAVVILAVGLLGLPAITGAQPPGKVARVAYLSPGMPTTPGPRYPFYPDVLWQALRELGWVQGQNLGIEYRWGLGKPDMLPALARELVSLPVDVIVVGSGPAALAAKQATTTIPIVIAWASDPVELGLVASLARPGGNVTGLSFQSLDLGAKQLQLLKEVVPSARRVALLVPGDVERLSGKLDSPARSLGVALHVVLVKAPEELDDAFATMTRERDDALFVVVGPTFAAHRARVAELALKHRLPTMFASGGGEMVEAGGLMSYLPHLREFFRRAATYVDKILRGVKPADLPVEQPTRFELLVNLKTARALGLTIPPAVLLRADDVIE